MPLRNIADFPLHRIQPQNAHSNAHTWLFHDTLVYSMWRLDADALGDGSCDECSD
jgi:hypothetical protein